MDGSFLIRCICIGLASCFYFTCSIGIPHPAYSEDINNYSICMPLQDCLKRAEQGDIRAQARLGALYFNGGDTTDDGKTVPQDFKKALMWRMKAAEQGHVQSQYDLGIMYYQGNGVEQDIGESYYWLTKAAEQGYSRAQYSLGMMHGKGEYVPKNYDIAHMWLLKAAMQGEPTSQLMLGHMYKQGLGVSIDYKQAYAWFYNAAENGNKQAVVERKKLEKLLIAHNENEFETAKELAQQYSKQYVNMSRVRRKKFYE